MRRALQLLSILLCSYLLLSCQQKNSYEKMLERELATGIRNDSLFMGMYLGMPSKEFYTHCWNLNKEGKIRQGSSNATVYARVSNFGEPAEMNFYPEFFEGKIIKMPVDFAYEAWAPWNQELHADSLQLEVKALVEKWHGSKNEFISVKNPNKFLGGVGFLRMDGNRRTFIHRVNERTVRLEFTDMVANQKMESQGTTAIE